MFRFIALVLLLLPTVRLSAQASVWWSYRPLQDVAVPAIKSDWVRSPVDAFLLSELSAREIEPSPAADRRTLIRRLSFDLHGLRFIALVCIFVCIALHCLLALLCIVLLSFVFCVEPNVRGS